MQQAQRPPRLAPGLHSNCHSDWHCHTHGATPHTAMNVMNTSWQHRQSIESNSHLHLQQPQLRQPTSAYLMSSPCSSGTLAQRWCTSPLHAACMGPCKSSYPARRMWWEKSACLHGADSFCFCSSRHCNTSADPCTVVQQWWLAGKLALVAQAEAHLVSVMLVAR